MSTSSRLPDPYLEQISDGIYAYIQPDGTWWINNTGVLVGSQYTIAIDSTSTLKRTQELKKAIATVSDRPVQVLVNTHHHGDHTNGNFLFEQATIVAHQACRDLIVADGKAGIERLHAGGIWAGPEGGPDWGDIQPAPPFLTYTDRINLYLDDLLCEVIHVGTPAHTTNDSLIWIPERKVLFCGDLLFNGGTPFVMMGSVTGSLEVVEALRQYDAEVIVPGHGPLATPELIDPVLRYLQFVLETARSGRAAGLSPLELAQQTDLGEFSQLTDAERIVGNLHRAYADLDETRPRGAVIDTRAAIGDMIAYNGGAPLTCLA